MITKQTFTGIKLQARDLMSQIDGGCDPTEARERAEQIFTMIEACETDMELNPLSDSPCKVCADSKEKALVDVKIICESVQEAVPDFRHLRNEVPAANKPKHEGQDHGGNMANGFNI